MRAWVSSIWRAAPRRRNQPGASRAPPPTPPVDPRRRRRASLPAAGNPSCPARPRFLAAAGAGPPRIRGPCHVQRPRPAARAGASGPRVPADPRRTDRRAADRKRRSHAEDCRGRSQPEQSAGRLRAGALKLALSPICMIRCDDYLSNHHMYFSLSNCRLASHRFSIASGEALENLAW